MSIYEVEAYTPYRGAIIKVTAECERNIATGRIRTATAKVVGYRPDAFSDEFDRLDLRTEELPDGGEIEIVWAHKLGMMSRQHSTETHLDEREENWEKFPSIIEELKRRFQDPPAPTPLSAQVAEVVESAKEAVDTYLEDRSIEVDTEEFRHGLDSALTKPLNGVSVEKSEPTGEYDGEEEDISTVISTLQSGVPEAESESR